MYFDSKGVLQTLAADPEYTAQVEVFDYRGDLIAGLFIKKEGAADVY